MCPLLPLRPACGTPARGGRAWRGSRARGRGRAAPRRWRGVRRRPACRSLGAVDAVLPLLAELLGHHVDERRENRVAAGRRRPPGERQCRDARKACGSSREANMPVASSLTAIMSSGVACRAARPATATSSTSRAWNIWSRVNPWSAAWKRSASVPNAGGPPAMNEPAPGRITTTPISASDRRPARRLGRLTPSVRASSRSAGRRSPPLSSPRSSRPRTCATTSALASDPRCSRMTVKPPQVRPERP